MIRRHLASASAVLAASLTLGLLVPATPAGAVTSPVVTGLVSAKADGTISNGTTTSTMKPSGNGRYVAFSSTSTDLLPGLPVLSQAIFVKDLLTDEVEYLSKTFEGGIISQNARVGDISYDGRYVVFVTNGALVPADTGTDYDVYLVDRTTDLPELISVNSSEVEGNGTSGDSSWGAASVSDDGRYVAFQSDATNLTTGDNNAKTDIFRRDRTAGTTSLVSINAAVPSNGNSTRPSMSGDGRYVAFQTASTGWGGTDTNNQTDVYLRDFSAISLTKVSVGNDGDPNSYSGLPQVSDNGRYIAFESAATDLVTGDTNASIDIFVRDTTNATTTRVSVNSSEQQLDLGGVEPAMTANGQRIAFTSTSADAVAGDTNATRDVFVRAGGNTTLESVTTAGTQLTQEPSRIAITDSSVLWTSAGAYTSNDTNGGYDTYVRKTAFIGPHPTFENFVSRQLTGFTGSAALGTVAGDAERLRTGVSPEHYVVRLSQADAFGLKRGRIVRLYWAYFKRRPDLAGLNFWLNKYNAGTLFLNTISQKFAQSTEFQTKYGNTTNTQFVTLVYQNVLEREPDSAGLTYWADAITNGTPRGQVMTSFSETTEGKKVMEPYVSTVVIGIGMYGKIVPLNLFDAIVTDRKAGWPVETTVDYILGYPDYATTLGL